MGRRDDKKSPGSGLWPVLAGIAAGAAVVGMGFLAAESVESEKLARSKREYESDDEDKKVMDTVCIICFSNYDKGKHSPYAFGCGHTACKSCCGGISNCHVCRKPIESRLRLYLD